MLKNLIEFVKKYKLLAIVVGLLLLLLLITTMMGGSNKSNENTSRTLNTQNNSQVVDAAAGDDAAESLNALTQQLHQVIQSNKQLKNSNAALNKKNAKILENIRGEVQKNLEIELRKRGQDNQEKIAKLQQALTNVNTELKKVKTKQNQPSYGGAYTVDGGKGQSNVGNVVNVNGEKLVSMPSVSGSVNQSNTDSSSTNSINGNSSGSILHPNGQPSSSTVKKKLKPIPYYTIPSGATLAGSVTMSALIGRVPVNGVVKSPYPFKMIICGNNMAANGHHIPGISGAIIQGYTVGDMNLSCVKGYITTITFVFPDGTISTDKVNATSDGSSLGFNNALGYISEPNGNPCFSGKFYTNAPKYLATMMTLGALNVGGSAYQQAQQTTMTNAMGGTTSALTGSVEKAMLGGAVQGGTQQVMNWYTQREKNSFDAVYVPAGKKAVINISKQVDINYNPNGRKIYYEHTKNANDNTSLD